MIGIAAWGKCFGLVSSFQVVGGIIGVGVFLFFVALAGLIGAMKHHQVLLFFVSFTVLMQTVYYNFVRSVKTAVRLYMRENQLSIYR